MAFLQVSNLGKEHGGRYVLRDVNLSIEAGEVFALIGPTGAGKTTLLRLLDLLDPPSSGQIYLDGVDVTRSGRDRLRARRRMAYVQQKPIAFSTNVYGNVACGLKWRREAKAAIRHKVGDALEMVGLGEFAGRDAKTLSGGEMQRVAIARALVTVPEMLLLDEPTANLDPVSVAKVEEVLSHVIAERRTTVVMATHDMSQGQRLAKRIGVLIDGELLQEGIPSDIFCSPQSMEVAEFVGVENILPGVITAKEEEISIVSLNGYNIQTVTSFDIGDKVYALIRPEEITLSLSGEISSARNLVTGKITRMALLGPLARIEIDCGFPLLVVLTAVSAQDLDLTIGKQVYASFKATALHIIGRQD